LDIAGRETSSLDTESKLPPSSSEHPTLAPVVHGEVKRRKRSMLASIFTPEDVTSVSAYIIGDVLVPKARDMIANTLKDSVDAIFYGTDAAPAKHSSMASKVSYRKYYDQKQDTQRRTSSVAREPLTYEYEEVVIESKAEAAEVIDKMNEIIDVYGHASIADMNQLLNMTGKWTDNDYGWDDISDARIVHTRDGYSIKMPRVIPLDRR